MLGVALQGFLELGERVDLLMERGEVVRVRVAALVELSMFITTEGLGERNSALAFMASQEGELHG